MKLLAFAAIAATAATLMLASMAVAQTVEGPEVDWKLSVWGKKRGMTAGMEYVSGQLAERTGGKFNLTIHYGEALSKSRENLDGIQIGAFEAAFFCNFYHPGKNPAWMVLTMPFLPLDTPEIAQRVRARMLEHPAFIADMDRWNAMPYMSAVLPTYQFMGRGEPPASLEDWKGLRVRAGGGIGSAMKALGAIPTSVPAPEIYTSLERGALDAVSMPFTDSLKSFKVDEVSSWYTSNLSPGTTECAIVFNKDAFAALPPQYRDLLMELRAPAYETHLAAYEALDAKNLPVFERNLTEVVYTPEQLGEFRRVAGRPVWDAWVAGNQGKFNAGQVLDDLLAAAAEAAGN